MSHSRKGWRAAAALAFSLLALGVVGAAQTQAAPQYYEVVARHSGKCLDVAHTSTSHGADVIQGVCWRGHNQQWRFRRRRLTAAR